MGKPHVRIVITDLADPANAINHQGRGTFEGESALAGVLARVGLGGTGGEHSVFCVQGKEAQIALILTDIIMHMNDQYPGFQQRLARMAEAAGQLWKNASRG